MGVTVPPCAPTRGASGVALRWPRGWAHQRLARAVVVDGRLDLPQEKHPRGRILRVLYALPPEHALVVADLQRLTGLQRPVVRRTSESSLQPPAYSPVRIRKEPMRSLHRPFRAVREGGPAPLRVAPGMWRWAGCGP
jgi:hypothetical protein